MNKDYNKYIPYLELMDRAFYVVHDLCTELDISRYMHIIWSIGKTSTGQMSIYEAFNDIDRFILETIGAGIVCDNDKYDWYFKFRDSELEAKIYKLYNEFHEHKGDFTHAEKLEDGKYKTETDMTTAKEVLENINMAEFSKLNLKVWSD